MHQLPYIIQIEISMIKFYKHFLGFAPIGMLRKVKKHESSMVAMIEHSMIRTGSIDCLQSY